MLCFVGLELKLMKVLVSLKICVFFEINVIFHFVKVNSIPILILATILKVKARITYYSMYCAKFYLCLN